ncbi:MAG TPA: L-aspartate oxidase [Dehalococcoidales bacterium]|nr:L-aspartate oxidase [Dehalococcoidales bacterium]
MNHFDFVIIGSGIAGLFSAILARKHGSVLIITKGSIEDCNTRYAQGGIAAAIGKNDSPTLHFKDTIAAGDGLCDKEAAHILVNEAPERIAELVRLGVPFDTLYGEIALTREAAHSVSRVVHAGGDATGQHIEVTLSNLVRSLKAQILEHSLATQILVRKGVVSGVQILNCRTGGTKEFSCRFLILATGGAGQLFKFTTNSAVATGDGLALAYDAGAEIIDMEFYQFHPTALHLPGVTPFLISEAVRGEGGILRNIKGHHFMPDYTSDSDLAPRDIVARSIIHEMRKTKSDKAFIDVTHLPAHTITTRFPNIYHFCREHGLDITRDLLPVAPAAHYMIGGIKTNIWGETNIPGLFACGETACVGVHGANRLASNSLLEAVVFSKRIIQRASGQVKIEEQATTQGLADIRTTLSQRQTQRKVPPPRLAALQTLLWNKVGIIRNKEGLTQAADTLASWQKLLPQPTTRSTYELSNLLLTGRLVVEAALLREESRGAHFRTDFPKTSPQRQGHLVFNKSTVYP